MENMCVSCGSIIPEGQMVCNACMHNTIAKLKQKKYSQIQDAEIVKMLRRCGSEKSCSQCEYARCADTDVCDAVLLQAADRLEALSYLFKDSWLEVVTRG